MNSIGYNKYRICKSIYGDFKIQKSRKISFFGNIIHQWWSNYSTEQQSLEKAEYLMNKWTNESIKKAKNNGRKWKPIQDINKWESIKNPKEKNMDNTNYGKAISYKKEYEKLKKELEVIKSEMLSIKQKAKNELNWIMNEKIDE